MILSRGHVDLDNDAIIKRCYDFLDEHNLQDIDTAWGQLRGALSSVVMAMYLKQKNLNHLMPHFWVELKPLVDEVESLIGEKIKISWFNILPPGTKLEPHKHIKGKVNGTVYGSVVYYPKLSTDDMALEIFDNGDWKPVPTVSGDWVSFDLECLHRVPVNTTNRHRISISFDI